MDIEVLKLKFINKAILKHGDKYDYSHVKYINSKTKVTINCIIHGFFDQAPNNHLRGNGCPACSSNGFVIPSEEIVKKIEDKNKSIKVLSLPVKVSDKIDVVDSYGIIYNCFTSSLLRGVHPGIRSAIDKTKAFIIKSNIIHNNKYNYENTEYSDCYGNVKIICPIHGEFIQSANNHLSNAGCLKCGIEKTNDYNRENPLGWSLREWINASENSKYFNSFKVYIIKCSNDNESFIKIGRTFQTVNRRFSLNNNMPYNYSIINIIEDNPYHIFKLENKLKMICKPHKYIPNIKFNGMYECFNIECLELIKDYI